MAGREDGRNEVLRRNVVEKMWLNYYNNELLAQGVDFGVDAAQDEVYQH